jgi:hypothetical protein
MTAQKLARLIATYRWLAHELTDQANTGATANGRQIREELDTLFLEIVNAPSDEPEICCVQVDFLVSALAEQTHDADVREMLREAVSTHVRHLASRIPRDNRSQRPASQRH